MGHRRVDFDLPKHIYANTRMDGTDLYYFRITRRPHSYNGPGRPTVKEALEDLHRFLIANPDKHPRYNGDDRSQITMYNRWNKKPPGVSE